MIRRPRPGLRPFVRSLWVAGGTGGERTPGAREHAIPTGEMHLVIRMSEEPVRLFADDDDRDGRTFGHAVVGGPRASFHVKDISVPVHAVGVQLHPAASLALFGAPAEELAGRHIRLDDVWPGDAGELRERLLEAGDPERQLDILEHALAVRLPRVQGIHPAVALALDRLRTTSDVGAVVKETGYSHRGLLARFRHTMGLAPKRYLRVLRMQRVLAHVGRAPLAEVAIAAGFSDQAHFTREFRDVTGVTPTAYLRARPAAPNHVRIVQDARAARR